MSLRGPLILIAFLMVAIVVISNGYKKTKPIKPIKPAPPPQQLWIPVTGFDIDDRSSFPLLNLKITTPQNSCLNVGPWMDSRDPEMRQIYYQAMEWGEGTQKEADCVAKAKPPVTFCNPPPEGAGFAFDFIKEACVPVEEHCNPNFRPRGTDKRFFLTMYKDLTECTLKVRSVAPPIPAEAPSPTLPPSAEANAQPKAEPSPAASPGASPPPAQ